MLSAAIDVTPVRAYSVARARRNVLGYRLLGAITPDQAVDTVFPQSAITGKPGFSQTDWNNMLQAVKNGVFYQSQGWAGTDVSGMEASYCKGGQQPSTGAQIVKSGTGFAIQFAGTAVASAIGMAAAPFTFGLSALAGLFTSIFTHHSQMVAKEQALFCSILPAARDTLWAIEKAVNNGTITPQQAIDGLQSYQQEFETNLSSMLQMNSDTCNAECIWVKQSRAIVAYLTSQYQDKIAAQTQPAQPAVVTSGSTMTLPAALPAAATALPSWLPIAALLVGAVFVGSMVLG